VLAVMGSVFAVRRAVFDELDGWDDLYYYYYEDVDFCLRARASGWNVVVVLTAVVHHVFSATARDSELKPYYMFRNHLLLLVVHWPFGLLLVAAPRLLLSECWRLVVRVSRGVRLEARSQVWVWGSFLRLLFAVFARRRRRNPQRD
jgi:GT2 family glycosyltransferase